MCWERTPLDDYGWSSWLSWSPQWPLPNPVFQRSKVWSPNVLICLYFSHHQLIHLQSSITLISSILILIHPISYRRVKMDCLREQKKTQKNRCRIKQSWKDINWNLPQSRWSGEEENCLKKKMSGNPGALMQLYDATLWWNGPQETHMMI